MDGLLSYFKYGRCYIDELLLFFLAIPCFTDIINISKRHFHLMFYVPEHQSPLREFIKTIKRKQFNQILLRYHPSMIFTTSCRTIDHTCLHIESCYSRPATQRRFIMTPSFRNVITDKHKLTRWDEICHWCCGLTMWNVTTLRYSMVFTTHLEWSALMVFNVLSWLFQSISTSREKRDRKDEDKGGRHA